MPVLSEWDVLDRAVTRFCASPEGRVFFRDLETRRHAMQRIQRSRVGASSHHAAIVGMSHGGTMKFAGSLPQELYFLAKRLFPKEPPKKLEDKLMRRYKVFTAEGLP